eukprot:TRINITY_DN16608_c0_g1_i1.p1 TRINITY_DN16608_c0_g1~~TRINITY_DN16608_c0_g1_i1.p1  ORF type:complete len:363 (+),score=66.62 TRINITY_DN16608_c0_g1_i1:270-1358(+)
MSPLKIGRLESPPEASPLIKDFRQMRAKLMEAGYFKPSLSFFAAQLLQIVLLEIVGHCLALYFGLSGWLNWIVVASVLATGQIQAGWLQHDLGHLSVFPVHPRAIPKENCSILKENQSWHYLVICFMKGASSSWWKYRHNQHHSKPNIINKDPDLKNDPLFVFGGMADLGMGTPMTPYQETYWWFLGPPLVTSFYFVLTNYYYVFKWRLWGEFILAHIYFARTWILLRIATGSWVACFSLYFIMRVMESIWFTWVTAMNHFPMTIQMDPKVDWVTAQLTASQNLPNTPFSRWFSGHLAHQIEHHLFPTMPRHNLTKIIPLIKSFCQRHSLSYKEVTIQQGCQEVLQALRLAANTYQNQHKRK